MLTMVTEVFGVSGGYGNLSIQPKLLASQFDADGRACINLPFAGKLLRISFVNRTRHEYGSYGIFAASCGGSAVTDGECVGKKWFIRFKLARRDGLHWNFARCLEAPTQEGLQKWTKQKHQQQERLKRRLEKMGEQQEEA